MFAQSKGETLLDQLKKARLLKSYKADTASSILLNKLAEQYLYNHTDSAMAFAKEALQLAEIQKYTVGQAASLNNISKTYYVIGDYTSSLDAAAKLMELSHRINYQPGIAGAYQVTGLIYLAQDKFDDAITNFKKALDLFIQQKDLAKQAKIYFDLGICYDESGKAQSAFSYLDKAIDIAGQAKDGNLVSMVNDRTGEAWFHLKDYSKALAYYQKSIDSKFTSNWELDFAYSGLAQTYYELGNYKNAITNAQKSLSIAQKVNSRSDKVRAYEILAKSYAAIKDYKLAYNYHVLLKQSNDSLFDAEKEKDVNYRHFKQQQADNVRLENKIKVREDTIAFSKKLLFFRNLIAVCVVIFLMILIWNIRQKTDLNKVLKAQKEEILMQKEELDQLNNTKDRLFSVISHDLRGPFASVLQTMDLVRTGDISPKEQAVLMDGFYQQVSLVAVMVNNLLTWANSQQYGIKCDKTEFNITGVINEIISVSNYQATTKKIALKHQDAGVKTVCADLNHVKIIIQNLLGNAIKFTPNGGAVEIYYTEDGEYQVVHVKDNGIGILQHRMDKLFKVIGKEISGYGTNNEAGAGIGLALIKQFADANDGKLEVHSKPGEGSEFRVYLRKQV
jgi:signal transduction histidine kinase